MFSSDSYTDGYCRVSTPKQSKIGHALERYKEDLIYYGVPSDRIFFDVESGADGDRAGYNTVLERVRQGITRRIVVPCFDRFTRSPLLWEEAIVEFQRYGAQLQALSGGLVDLDSPEGIYRSRIDAAAAAYVREKNSHNATQGWERTRRLQKAVNPPFGYRVEGDRYVINHQIYPKGGTVVEVAREVVETFLSDGTQRGTVRRLIAKYGLNQISSRNGDDFARDRTKLRQWLQNPILRGYTAYFGNRGRHRLVIPEITHEALISPQEAVQIDRLLDAKSKRGGMPTQATYTVSGLVFCECGSRCIKRKQRYYCSNVYDNPLPSTCDRRNGLLLQEAENAAIWAITTQAARIAQWIDIPEIEETPELQALRRKLAVLGDDPDFEASRRELQIKIVNLEHQQQLVADTLNHKRQELIAAGTDPAFWLSLFDDEKRFVFTQLVDRIVKSRDRVLRVELATGLGCVSLEDGNNSE